MLGGPLDMPRFAFAAAAAAAATAAAWFASIELARVSYGVVLVDGVVGSRCVAGSAEKFVVALGAPPGGDSRACETYKPLLSLTML